MPKHRIFVVILTVEGSILDYLNEVPLNGETLSNTLVLYLKEIEASGDCEVSNVIVPGVIDA